LNAKAHGYYTDNYRSRTFQQHPQKHLIVKGPRGRDHMVVGFTATSAISAYHHRSCEFEPRSWRSVLDTTQCDKVCQSLAAGRWFSPGTPVSSSNKTDRHDITEILLNN